MMLKGITFTASLFAVALLSGCAGKPYQPTQAPDQSIASTIFRDGSVPLIDNKLRDTPKGGADSYVGSDMGALFGLVGMIGSTPNPAGMISALANSTEAGGPVQARPLLFGYLPVDGNEAKLSGATGMRDVLGRALEKLADANGGSVTHRLDTSVGDKKLDGWAVTIPRLGCPESNPCAMRSYLTVTSHVGRMPPALVSQKTGYRKLMAETQSPVVAEGASQPTAWRLLQQNETNYSQAVFVQQGMDSDDLRPLYQALSEQLNDAFYLFLPPEQEYGLPQNYPYMLNAGEVLKFESRG